MAKQKFGSAFMGNQLILHDNHLEIVAGCAPFRRKKKIPYRSIANVEKSQFLNQVIIHTNDGKTHKYSVGNAAAIQDAILEKL